MVASAKKMIKLFLVFILLSSGCSSKSKPIEKEVNNEIEQEVEKVSTPKLKYLKEANNYKIKELDVLSNLPLSGTGIFDKEVMTFAVKNGKATIMVSVLRRAMDTFGWTKRLYTYDFKNDEFKLIKDYDKNVSIVDFVEFDGANYYAYATQINSSRIFEISIIEERDGVEKELKKSHIENLLEGVPDFQVVNNTLYFMMSDIVPVEDNYENATYVQHLFSLKDNKLMQEFENKAEFVNYDFVEGTDRIYFHRMYTQPQGNIMFQQFHSDVSTLHYKEDETWKTFELPVTDFIIGYVGNYVILYEQATKQNALLNLETNERVILDNNDKLEMPSDFMGGTSIKYMDSITNEYNIMMLQEDGTIKTEKINLLDQLDLDDKQKKGAFIKLATDGTYVLCGYEENADYGIEQGKYFVLDYGLNAE